MPRRSKEDRIDWPDVIVIINNEHAYLIKDGKGRYHAMQKAITIHRNIFTFYIDRDTRLYRERHIGSIDQIDKWCIMREIASIQVYEVEADYDEEDESETA